MRVAVTGGNGAIGVYVCDELRKAGYEVVSVDRMPSKDGRPFVQVDLMDREATAEALAGFDQIVHLAAIPDPFSDPPEVVIGENTRTTFNVMEAARTNGVKRVVYGCSDSSTGFGIHNTALRPLYLPLDEDHPLWPHESYSLSKHFGERMCQTYAKAYQLETISLRYQYVMVKRAEKAAKEQAKRAQEGFFDAEHAWLGGYISVRDVARACLAAVNYRFPADQDEPYEAFFLSARNTLYPVPTMEVFQAIWDEVPPIKDPSYYAQDPYASAYDIRKAERLMGWKPQDEWKDIDTLEF